MIMLKEQLTELINTLYEAEGLVDMALRRDVTADDRVLYLALAKCHDVSRKAAEINIGTTAGQAEDAAPVYAAAPATVAQTVDGQETVADTMASDAGMQEKEVEVFANEVLPRVKASVDVADISDASIFDNDDASPDIHDAGNVDAHGFGGEDARLGHAGVRKPIIRAFSINDKYRYRRTLFEDNDMLMRDTLAEFETMAGFGEALDYCAQALGWDVDSGEAKGFVAILEKYYKS